MNILGGNVVLLTDGSLMPGFSVSVKEAVFSSPANKGLESILRDAPVGMIIPLDCMHRHS